jgi:hypothetical protein
MPPDHQKIPLFQIEGRERSKNSITGKYFCQLITTLEIPQRVMLARDFIEGDLQYTLFGTFGNNHQTVCIPHDQVPRLDPNTCTLNGDIQRHDSTPAFAVQRCNSAMENRKFHGTDGAHIPRTTIHHGPGRPASLRGC